MTFRYYSDQLAKLEPTERRRLEGCATAKTDKWIEVPSACVGLPESRTDIALPPDVPPSGPLRRAEHSTGLGDSIKKLADATGLSHLAKIYEQISGRPCGCGERQKKLNALFPYNR